MSPDFQSVLAIISAATLVTAIIAVAAVYALVNFMESTSKLVSRFFGPIDDREG